MAYFFSQNLFAYFVRFAHCWITYILQYHMKMKSQKTEEFISRRKSEITHYVNTCTMSTFESVKCSVCSGGWGGGGVIISLNIPRNTVLLLCLFLYRLEQLLIQKCCSRESWRGHIYVKRAFVEGNMGENGSKFRCCWIT